ncbi:hypothetical protein, variant [Aphanomyces invadans]|uniref:beta-glucosidase n=1 Tax=Aphanomyces invadans TaxID=157072 RepID=A0A024UQZ8_9STRA|nr:hypothetical protein, variant [Aphanomyces invadans]ETW08033.1 hypothetical protein, variant [Aphanomyces invadans]|eukprot:XP_008864126.1 hypothetical protein, variant [Aphanomyces invadans]
MLQALHRIFRPDGRQRSHGCGAVEAPSAQLFCAAIQSCDRSRRAVWDGHVRRLERRPHGGQQRHVQLAAPPRLELLGTYGHRLGRDVSAARSSQTRPVGTRSDCGWNEPNDVRHGDDSSRHELHQVWPPTCQHRSVGPSTARAGGADLVDLVGDNASRAAAIVVAQESIVLLKNDDHVLPLGRPPTTTTTNHTMSLFLTGPSIDNIGLQCGGWSLAWQGIDGNAAFPHGQSIRHAINATVRAWNLTAASTDTIAANENGIPRLDHVNVTFLQAMDIYGNFTSNESLQEAIALASTATHTIVALGERNYAEQFGNSDPQALPPAFVTYVKALATTKTRIILVVVAGRPRILNGLAELCHAVLWAGLPCEAGGQAIADVLFGRVNPSAKLPFTYPKTDGHVNLATPYYYRSNDVGSTACVRGGKEFSTDCATEYPFGAGLSYTTFDYTNMQVTPTTLTSDAAAVVVTASVVVTNTGRVAGKEVVMLFVSPPPSLHNETETRLLKRFAKIWLAPGESTVVRFDITPSDWGFYHNEFGTGLRKTAPSGSYVVHFKPTTNCADPSTSLCQTVRWENRSGAAAAWNAWHWVVAVLAWVAAL